MLVIKKLGSLNICLFILVQLSFGQLEKGNFTIGSQTGLLGDITNASNLIFQEKAKFSFAIHPNVGYFIRDDWVLGGKIGFGGEFVLGGESILFGIQPFSRMYFKEFQQNALFTEVAIGGFGVYETASELIYGFIVDGGLGYSRLFWNRISLDGLFKISYIEFSGDNTLDFGVRFGLQVYLFKTAVD